MTGPRTALLLVALVLLILPNSGQATPNPQQPEPTPCDCNPNDPFYPHYIYAPASTTVSCTYSGNCDPSGANTGEEVYTPTTPTVSGAPSTLQPNGMP